MFRPAYECAQHPQAGQNTQQSPILAASQIHITQLKRFRLIFQAWQSFGHLEHCIN